MPLAQRSLRSRTLLCALAFALWAATTLGLLHRTLHGSPPAPARRSTRRRTLTV